ncbi:SpaA isopeptide-forming pilin-related protein [Raoultibacter phocaeensis]|uniref:SpaA isopeptide-forming pilin-related protein n=1 Tax=Raoultibacter phocaeensis TaxID=2479841 RepID=UPI00111B431D|nr:Cna B-type domain-containing protein [Raoultibacter phocaeensis]
MRPTATIRLHRACALMFALLLIAGSVPLTARAEQSDRASRAPASSIDLIARADPIATLTPDGSAAGRPAVFASLTAHGRIVEAGGQHKLELGFELALDDDALQENLMTWLDAHPDVDPGDIDTALDGDSGLVAISFAFEYALSDTVVLPSGATENDIVVTVGGSLETIGSYTYEPVPEGTSLRVEGTFFKHMYSHQGVTAGEYFQLDLEAGHTGTPEVALTPENGSVGASVSFIGDEPEDGTYTIEKSVKAREANDPNLSYAITARTEPSSAKANLAGKTITDTLPAGLEFAGARDKAGNALIEGSDAGCYRYDPATRTFSYLVPENATDPQAAVSEATVVIDAYVSGSLYAEFLAGDASGATTFENTASVCKPGEDAPLTTSLPANARFGGTGDEGRALAKSGTRTGVNGDQYEWTLKASAYLNGGSVWLVDRIQGIETTHDYTRTGGAVAYAVDSVPGSAAVVTPAQPVRFDDISPSALSSLTSGGTQAVTYSYDTDSDGTDDEAVLIVPLADPTQRNKTVTLTYATTVKADPAAGGTAQVALKNDATMAWDKARYQTGPEGTGATPTFSVEKDISDEFSLLRKSAGAYNEHKHEMVWDIKLNLAGEDLGAGTQTVTDTFDTDKQAFKELHYRVDGGSWAAVADAAANPAASPRYTLANDPVAGTTSLLVSIDAVGTHLYEFQLAATVIDPAVLSAPKNGAVHNEVAADLTVEGIQRSVSDAATKTVPNVLLEKRALKLDGTTVGTEYDYENHQLTWQITVNPHHVALSPVETGGAVTDPVTLTDSLPEGTTFNELLSVTRIAADGSEALLDITPHPATGPITGATVTNPTKDAFLIEMTTSETTGTAGYSNDSAIFSFMPKGAGTATDAQGAFDDAFVFTFTTTVDQDYRTATFTDTSKTYTLANAANLKGTVIGSATGAAGIPHAAVDANARAEQKVHAQPISKSGTFHPASESGNPYEATLGPVAYADWTIVFNKHACDMEGAELKDALPACYELDLDSLVFSRAVIDSGGVAAAGAPLTEDEIATLALDTACDGFSFTVPPTLKEQPLIITFKTLVIDTVAAQGLTNTAELYRNGTRQTNSTFQPTNAANFDASSYASALKTPWLSVTKSSTNSVDDAAGMPEHAIGNATFALGTAKQWDNVSGTWSDAATLRGKTAVTKESNGSASFWFLAYDTLYTLAETVPPSGYANDFAPCSVVFVRDSGLFADQAFSAGLPAGTLIVAADGSTSVAGSGITPPPVAVSTQGGVLRGATLYAADTPSAGVSFTKTTDRGGSVAGMSFTLTSTDDSLAPQTAVSDEYGRVVFPAVDPGSYSLAETPTATQQAQFADAPACTVEMAPDGSFTIASPDDPPSVRHEGGAYAIVNTYKTGTVSLTKADAEDPDSLLSGAEFALFAQNGSVLAAYLLEDAAHPGTYVLSETDDLSNLGEIGADEHGAPYLAADASGTLALTAGTYTLFETVAPIGYSPEIPAAQRTVVIDGSEPNTMLVVENGKALVAHTVQKIWADDEDADGLRPALIEVQLLADGAPLGDPVQLDGAMGWTHRWEDLPEQTDTGAIVAYSVVESAVPEGYAATYETAEGMSVITNSHVPASVGSEPGEDPDGGEAEPPVDKLEPSDANRQRGKASADLSAAGDTPIASVLFGLGCAAALLAGAAGLHVRRGARSER